LEPSKRKTPSHFPYAHPLFGRAKTTQIDSQGIKRSPYYWWWEFLRRSSRYASTCANGGKGPLKDLYRDFGDVHNIDFKTWWKDGDRGAKLFANQSREERVLIYRSGDSIEWVDSMIYIMVPIGLPRKHIEARIKSILDKEHKGKQGKRYTSQSTARYIPQSAVNVNALEMRLRVHDARSLDPKKTLWMIGLEVIPSLKSEPHTLKKGKIYLDPARRNVISAQVARYLKEAQSIIVNVESGTFP
jgi:hypothetical protein